MLRGCKWSLIKRKIIDSTSLELIHKHTQDILGKMEILNQDNLISKNSNEDAQASANEF